MANHIGNPFAAIARIQWGWSAEQIKAGIGDLTPESAQRWQHNFDGAQVAFESVNFLGFARIAKELSQWTAEIAQAESLDVMA